MSNNQDAFGKLVIKASLGTDIRILPINNEDLTYDELALMMQRVFKDKLKDIDTNTGLSFKYKDNAGDLVSIMDTSDLTYAVHECSPLLRLHLCCTHSTLCYQMDGTGLAALRQQCQSLLALLDDLTVVAVKPRDVLQQVANMQIAGGPGTTSDHSDGSSHQHPQQEPPKEFDPLCRDASGSNSSSIPTTPSHSVPITDSGVLLDRSQSRAASSTPQMLANTGAQYRQGTGPGLQNAGPGLPNAGPGLANAGPGLANAGPGLANAGPGLPNSGPIAMKSGPVIANAGSGLSNSASGGPNSGPGAPSYGPGGPNSGPGGPNSGTGAGSRVPDVSQPNSSATSVQTTSSAPPSSGGQSQYYAGYPVTATQAAGAYQPYSFDQQPGGYYYPPMQSGPTSYQYPMTATSPTTQPRPASTNYSTTGPGYQTAPYHYK